MEIYNEDIIDVELTGGNISRSFMGKTIGEGDILANRFGVKVMRNGNPVQLTGVSCAGYFIRSDGGTIPINGSVSGNKAYVDLPQACYAIEGQFSLAIKLSGGSVTGTVRIVDGVVSNTTTGIPIDPGTIIPSVETLIEAIEAAIANIPADYSQVTNSLNAQFCLHDGQQIIFNYDDKTISFPYGSFLFNNGTTKSNSQRQDIDLSDKLSLNSACVFYLTADGAIYAVPWRDAQSLSTNDHFIGYIYDKNLFINGVSKKNAIVVNHDGGRIDIQTQSGAMYGNNENYYFVWNPETHKLTTPGGFYSFHGIGHAVSSQEVDLSSFTTAAILFIKTDGTIYGTNWENNVPQGYDDEPIGWVYGNNIYISGTDKEQIKIANNAGDVLPGVMGSTAAIGISNEMLVVFDYDNKTLTIPPAFTVSYGKGMARSSETVLSLASVMRSEACTLFVKKDGTIYAKDWHGCFAEHPTDQFVGYIFRKYVCISGVNESKIAVISADKKVFCFGDSITAGVGTSKLYHMYWREYDPTVTYYNWGIGSTGYVLEWTGTAVVGGGAIGDGTTKNVSGNNNVLKVMQSVGGNMANICIFSGTNDFGNDIALETFRTAVQNTLDYALTKTPKVFVITPIKRNGWATAVNAHGLHLKDYCDVITEECENRGIAHADGYDVFLNPSLENIRTAFMPDGLHPNEAGQARIARAMQAKMLEAFCI